MATNNVNNPPLDDRTRYDNLKREILTALPKKRKLEKALAAVECHIYNTEGSYLAETSTHGGGNIIQGFENYLKNQGVGRRKADAPDNDRIFSTSSSTYLRSLDLEADDSISGDEYRQGGPTTVVVPPATRTQELSVAQQNKLIRDKEYQRKKRASAGGSRRSAGTVSDDEIVPPSSSGRRPTKRARMADEE